MLTITENSESRPFSRLLFFILTLFCISITSSLLKTMIFIYDCQENFVKLEKIFQAGSRSPKFTNRKSFV